jgi:hypothetical protein
MKATGRTPFAQGGRIRAMRMKMFALGFFTLYFVVFMVMAAMASGIH